MTSLTCRIFFIIILASIFSFALLFVWNGLGHHLYRCNLSFMISLFLVCWFVNFFILNILTNLLFLSFNIYWSFLSYFRNFFFNFLLFRNWWSFGNIWLCFRLFNWFIFSKSLYSNEKICVLYLSLALRSYKLIYNWK